VQVKGVLELQVRVEVAQDLSVGDRHPLGAPHGLGVVERDEQLEDGVEGAADVVDVVDVHDLVCHEREGL
jgi:hypothetical protein